MLLGLVRLSAQLRYVVLLCPLCSAGGAVLPGQDVAPDGSSGGGGVEDGVRITAEPPQHQRREVEVIQLKGKERKVLNLVLTPHQMYKWKVLVLSLLLGEVWQCWLRCWCTVGPRWCSAPCLTHKHTCHQEYTHLDQYYHFNTFTLSLYSWRKNPRETLIFCCMISWISHPH